MSRTIVTDEETLREIVRAEVEAALSGRGEPQARLLSPDEAAELLGVTRQTVLRMAAAGRIPCVRLSSQLIRFREADVRRAG